jgi:acetylornithine deacetylase/succinyl-diaminopimelate desuccinylase-like protein
MELNWDDIGRESVALFRGLLRIDTTNPPGNETAAAEYLADSLRRDGIEPTLLSSVAGRDNLVARLPATTKNPKPPLLLAGHTDVVPAAAQNWTYPPFSATEADGLIWGRGAVDMKNMVSMSVMVLKLFKRMDIPRDRDIILAAVADEEEGCRHGTQFLVEEHPELVRAEYMLGEVGGFWLHVNGVTYMPIMTAEKGQAIVNMKATGPTGHGSIPREDNSLIRLSRALDRIGDRRLQHRVVPAMEHFIRVLAATQPAPAKFVLPLLLRSAAAGFILDKVLPEPELARSFSALLHNTVSPTMMSAGIKKNVIPGEAECVLDGRMLPGVGANELIEELREIVDDPQIEFETITENRGVHMEKFNTPLYRTIEAVVGEHSPKTVVTPYLIPGFTDAQYFHRLGMKCYGFSPIKLEAELNLKFSELFHGVDERIPTDGYVWGQRVLFDVVRRFLSGADL